MREEDNLNHTPPILWELGYIPPLKPRGPSAIWKGFDASKSRGCQMLFLRDLQQFGVRETKHKSTCMARENSCSLFLRVNLNITPHIIWTFVPMRFEKICESDFSLKPQSLS